MTNQPVRLVAFANGTYSQNAKLERSVPDAQALAKTLTEEHEYETFVFADTDCNRLQLAVRRRLGKGALAGGTLILSWTGHGLMGVDGTLRLLGNFDGEDVELSNAAQLGEWAAQTGALQILVLLDTCSSGAGLIDAAKLARSIVDQRASRRSAWFGVIAASLTDEPALSGALSRELQRLLRNGPKNPDLRWDRKREYVRGDDLIQALRDDWSESRQTPQILSTSSGAWDLVRNPLFERGLPDQVVEHLLQAAHGHSGTENFFTGRHSVLRRIVSWIGSRKPGLFVLTGPPGSGKSAILGRIVSLSSGEERERIFRVDAVPADLDPQQGSVDAHIQARGVTIDIAAEELLRRLGLNPAEGRFGLLGAAERRRKAGDPLVLAVDGLDEAGAIGREMAAEFLKPLAQQCLLIVATRDVQSYGQESLIATLGPAAELLDIGNEEGTPADIHDYVVRSLQDVDPTMDPARVADEIVAKGGAAGSFLFARLVTSQLRERPVNTSVENWELTLSATVESALERDLQSVVLQIDGRPHPTAAREMLRALTLAYGSGFPADDVWPAVATAISETETRFTRDDAYQTLKLMGRHLVAGSESGQAVYRLAHQRLVEYLVADSLAAINPEVQRQRRNVTAIAISDLYNDFLDSGFLPDKHQYLWRFGWRHLAEGGEEGLERLRGLAQRDRDAFLPDLASGLELASSLAVSAGLVAEAAEHLREAVEIWRQLPQPSRLSLALFQLAMVYLATGDQDSADAIATEASEVAEQVPESSGRRRMTALTLLGRAFTQLSEGQYLGARLLAEKASALGSPGDQAVVADGWELRALASLVAAKATGALGDWNAAGAFCETSVDLTRQYGNPETDHVFTDALATLIWSRISIALNNSKSGNEGVLPATSEAGARLLEGSARWRGDSIRKINVDRGLVGVVQARLLDEARGVDVSHLRSLDRDAIPGLLDQIIEDVAPLAATLIDAAWTCASALYLRASLRQASDEQLVHQERSRAIDILRPFSEKNPAIAAMLGAFLFESVSKELAQLSEHPDEAGELVERLRDAISLLRKNRSISGAQLAEAVARSPYIWQVVGRIDLQKASATEAVDELRTLDGKTPRASFLLAALLSDLSALNLDAPTVCEQLATEAYALASALPPSPQVEWILAMSEINIAAAKSLLRKFSEVSDLLNSAIRRIEPNEMNPMRSQVLGIAYANLAVAENRAGHYAQALKLSRSALNHLAEPTLYSFLGSASVFLARFAEGMALQHVGQSELGNAFVADAVSEALASYRAGEADPFRLAGILNEIGPQAWEDVLNGLNDSPNLLRRLRIQRFRPVDEIDQTVATLAEELACADPSELVEIRAVARSHRSFGAELFDAAWQRAIGEVPGWLQLDLNAIGSAILWISCNSKLSSRNYLEEHPVLLHRATNDILEEFRFAGVSGDLIDTLLEILSKARVTSVKDAYAPLLSADLVQRWLQSVHPIEYLSNNPELLSVDVVTFVSEMARQNNEIFGAIAGILELAQRDELGLLKEIEKTPNEALKYLQPAWRSKDVRRLAALASVVRAGSEEVSQKRKATAVLAVARVLEGRDTEGKILIVEAAEQAGAKEIADIIEILGDAIAYQQSFAPSFAALIQIITDDKANFATV